MQHVGAGALRLIEPLDGLAVEVHCQRGAAHYQDQDEALDVVLHVLRGRLGISKRWLRHQVCDPVPTTSQLRGTRNRL